MSTRVHPGRLPPSLAAGQPPGLPSFGTRSPLPAPALGVSHLRYRRVPLALADSVLAAASAAAQTYVDPARATIVIVGDASQFLEDLRAIRDNVEVIPSGELDLSSADLRAMAEMAEGEGD